ncbi:chemotaxis protein CheD [Tritonibacter mobilis]|jgi:chemotaxis protein CheD
MDKVEVSELHVRIGQVKIGSPGQVLTAILGSCVGIGFFFPQRQIYGLAHCLLSQSSSQPVASSAAQTGRTREDGQLVGNGRHVDKAIESLLKMMDIQDEERRQLRVVLAGGANMSMPFDTPPSQLVGSVNAKFARQAIRSAGLRLLGDDLGGLNGRRISINCDSGEYDIQQIPRLGGTVQ